MARIALTPAAAVTAEAVLTARIDAINAEWCAVNPGSTERIRDRLRHATAPGTRRTLTERDASWIGWFAKHPDSDQPAAPADAIAALLNELEAAAR